jgi:putative transcriptional regulator
MLLMTDEEVEEAANSDPDARPMTAEEWEAAPRTPQVKIIRRALRLTQEEFAERYYIPLDTLRDWEQGRSEPDQTARAYLQVIAVGPEIIQQLLQIEPRRI